jgi:hypothetical protein
VSYILGLSLDFPGFIQSGRVCLKVPKGLTMQFEPRSGSPAAAQSLPV